MVFIDKILELYVAIAILCSSYFLVLCILNVLWMKRHTFKASAKNGPRVSVLVPARNEEGCIGTCLENLVNQTYENYDIFILDDNSWDRTYEIASGFTEKYPDKVHVIKGKPLPQGWNGKCYAMEQLVGFADGEILVFTDADTVHSQESVSWAVTNILNNDLDFLSGYVYEDLQTLGEKLVVPNIFILTGFVIPLWLNKLIKLPVLSTAVGQYIAVKADSFRAAGGYGAVKSATTEDVYLARHMRSMGYKTLFLDIKDYVSCRMYDGYFSSVRGISKNIFDFIGKNKFLLFGLVLFIMLFTVLPIFFVFGLMSYNPLMAFYLLISVCFYILTWFIMLKDRNLSPFYSFLAPVLFFQLVLMALYAFYKINSGQGFEWKGRKVR